MVEIQSQLYHDEKNSSSSLYFVPVSDFTLLNPRRLLPCSTHGVSSLAQPTASPPFSTHGV
ncbi:hypothetical protein YC2023_114831 [Brassica napus]